MRSIKSIFVLSMLILGMSFTAHAQDMKAKKKPGTIVDVAAETGSLSTLVKAVKAAGLAETLSGEGPYTVFAPTNSAFKALPKGTLTSLMKPANKKKLAGILTYHVVPGKIMAADLEDGQTVTTVQGQEITISLSDDGAMVNNANVTKADVEASNGVVHIIDAVIMPNK